jgi:SAM dependent carboxyl methyltransferase
MISVGGHDWAGRQLRDGSRVGVDQFKTNKLRHQNMTAVTAVQTRLSPMEGAGAYNRHAKLQAAAGSLALPLFANAAENIPIDDRDKPIVIADYGSSQGKNSLAPRGIAVKALRRRVGPDRPIFVFHVDLPTNDFTSLFELADSDPNSYVLDEPNVLSSAIGRSFYRPVFPSGSVDLAWSSYAAHWLSQTPAYIPGHFVWLRGEGQIVAAFNRQGEDWEAFLTLRARELGQEGD